MESTVSGPADPMLGRVLDRRYQIERKIARGGMAVVYAAHDLRLDRTVAVKVMHPGLGEDPEFVARFEREARSAARLAHHNVVSVFDQGEDAGTLYLVMEYVPGLTLRDLIRKDAPLAPDKALAVLEPVLAALAAAHEAGMIHRDMKPENVLLGDDGRTKVADFGLARAVNAETQHTATAGMLMGTVSYLAPELVTAGRADARSDVYAAGVVMFEMLTGQKPHQADTAIQVAYKHVHDDVPPPSTLQPGLPDYVDALVARATARDLDQRPSDARTLLHQVRRVRLALDHGVRADPELSADLRPRPREAATAVTNRLDVSDLRSAPVVHDFYDQDAAALTQPVPTPSEPADLVARATRATSAAAGGNGGLITPRPASPPQPPLPPTISPERSSQRGRVLLAAVLALAALVGLGGWYLGVGRYTTTPAVLNLTAADAKAKIQDAGLVFAAGDPEYSESVAKGSALRTDPTPGARIREGGTVTVIFSLGPERYAVPTLRGKTEAEATRLLEAETLVVGGTERRFHESIPAGAVITTDPVAGTELKRGAAVTLIVSRGKRPIDIPDWTGKSGKDARKDLTELGFKVKSSSEFNDEVPEGLVISQSPSSGSGVRGDTITLVVSRGPELVEIPRVRGLSEESATKRLEKLGFQVETTRSGLYVGADIVVGSNPDAGAKAPKGSTVVLSLV